MRRFDLAPLYSSTIGFDRLLSLLGERDATAANPAYPPYNIERTSENEYRITLAVAGFSKDEISIESRENTLVITGSKTDETENTGKDDNVFLFKGIAARAFERSFQLADYVSVRSASLENGLLHVDLLREIPEAAKPKRIPVQSATDTAARTKKRSEGNPQNAIAA